MNKKFVYQVGNNKKVKTCMCTIQPISTHSYRNNSYLFVFKSLAFLIVITPLYWF